MTSAKAVVNVEIDAAVKDLAVGFFERIGLSQTTAIEMFYRQTIRERRLPFQPSVGEVTAGERIRAAIKAKNIPCVELEADENGNAVVDPKLHPDIYDWAVNG